jgi:hypothetical protein
MSDEVIDTTGEEIHEVHEGEVTDHEHHVNPTHVIPAEGPVEICVHPVDGLNFGATDNDGNVLCTGCDSYVKNPNAPDPTERISSDMIEAAQEAEVDYCASDEHDLDPAKAANDGGLQCRICGEYVGGKSPEEVKLTEKQEKANRVLELHAVIALKKNEVQAMYEELRQLTHFETDEEAAQWLSENGFTHEVTDSGVKVTSSTGQWHRNTSLIKAASHARSSSELKE